MKNIIFVITFIWAMNASNVVAQEPARQGDFKELFTGPLTSSDYPNWHKSMQQWRTEQKNKLNYSDAAYQHKQLKWMDSTFMYAQVMAHDRYLYDPNERKYTVDRFLKDVAKRYGGLDAVLIWPTYPNIGIDERNQFDLVSDMPGGLNGVKKMVNDFKKRGVRVFFPIMIWDKGTRITGITMADNLVNEMKTIGADGLNGDTMFGVTEDFFNASNQINYPLVLQPENSISDLKMIEWNQMSWGYFWPYAYSPGVSVYKWLETKHQVQVTNRWATDKTNDLQYAFFNGIGYNAWENVWGVWNRISERNAEAIRRISHIYKHFPGLWKSAGWEPHTPVLQKGIFASLFPGNDLKVYLIVNRDTADKNGRQLKLPYKQGAIYFDLWNGKQLIPERENDSIFLSFPMEALGFGAVMVSESGNINRGYQPFLTRMSNWAKSPLKSYSSSWNPLTQIMLPINPSKKSKTIPADMVLVTGSGEYEFESNGVMIEGSELPLAVGIQHSWEKHPARSQKHKLSIPSFYIDKYPVTNKQFKLFMDAIHYKPKDSHNFLKDWNNENYPKGWDDKPVTWVSIEDAREYARWAGKRLPHEWEWQYAGQGTTGQLYPWGKTLDSLLIPNRDTSRNRNILISDVDAFPTDSSKFGVRGMVGNVWQWTDEYTDDHTRFAVLKGGSYFKPQTSNWYFPPALELNKYGKYLLMAPSIDRSATIGFRCLMDE